MTTTSLFSATLDLRHGLLERREEAHDLRRHRLRRLRHRAGGRAPRPARPVRDARRRRARAWSRSEPWASRVTWLRGDALDPGTYAEHMRGADAVITSVGRLPFPHLTRDVIVRDNGETNVAPARCAAEVGVDRLVVIGASVPKMIPGVGWGFSPGGGIHDAGYAAGKAMAEAHARDEFVGGDAARRRRRGGAQTWAHLGTRIVGSRPLARVPLWAALGPLASVMRALPLPDAVAQMTPVHVDNVARAAVARRRRIHSPERVARYQTRSSSSDSATKARDDWKASSR